MRTCANLRNINASLSNILSWSVSAGKVVLSVCRDHMFVPPSQWTVKDAPVRPTAFPSSPSVTQTHMMDDVSSSLIKVPLVPSRSSVYHLRSRSKCDSFFSRLWSDETQTTTNYSVIGIQIFLSSSLGCVQIFYQCISILRSCLFRFWKEDTCLCSCGEYL